MSLFLMLLFISSRDITYSCLNFVCTNRQLTVFELTVNLWNSELFNPVAPPSRCHSDFAMAIVCSYGQVVGL